MSVELMIRVNNLPAHGHKSFRFIAFLVITLLVFGRKYGTDTSQKHWQQQVSSDLGAGFVP